MHYVYVLRSVRDGNFYVGVADDLKRRMGEHARGAVASTRNRRPLQLLGYEAYNERSDALRRERYLKSSDGRKEFRVRFASALEKVQLHAS